MSKHLEKVREALDNAEGVCIENGYTRSAQKCRDGLSALSAHEEEVRELVEALKVARDCLPQGTTADEVFDQIGAALAKVKE